ncbi:MAG: ribosome small subunit-dependent GTPase A [Actinomycetes bacterium]
MAVDRGRYTCRVDGSTVLAMKARELGRSGVVVGDQVALVGDVSGSAGTLARIVRVEARRSVLRRTADDLDPVERVMIANADQLVIVTSLARPEPNTRLVDRALVAAYDAGMDPLLCLTKADLAPPDDLLTAYAGLDVPWVVTRSDEDPGQLRRALHDRTSVLLGPSGVGKSTLVNTVVPGASRVTGRVNTLTGQGRHTSSSVIALALTDGGWIIDTPGIRSFGLGHVDPRHLLEAFDDLAAGTVGCPRGCRHDRDAAARGCALPAWVAAGHATVARLESWYRLLDAITTAGEG